jgi:D-amino-acid dehydrogenase
MSPKAGVSSAGDVTIIGAGIVGICTASWLQREGFSVTVLDRDEPGRGCSFGNAGGICPGSCVPMAMPGVMSKVPGWLLDPEGPLFIRLAYLPRALPWLIRFMAAGQPHRVNAIADAMRALHGPTIDAYKTLVEWAGCPELLYERGQLILYETDGELQADSFGRELRRTRGVRADILAADELRQLEPALSPIFKAAVYLPEQAQCADPFRLVQSLAARFVADGGRIERVDVEALERDGSRITALRTSRGPRPLDTLVVAAGAWSGRLLKSAGISVPIESERGYHVTVADAGVDLRIQSMWARRKFVASPMEPGLRIAGTDEFAGLEAPPDERRAMSLLKHGSEMLPGLEAENHTTWMGHRPGTPDSLPVIGRDIKYDNLLHAFGHGHTGLIGASVTGQLIADVLTGAAPRIDLAPYRIDRF